MSTSARYKDVTIRRFSVADMDLIEAAARKAGAQGGTAGAAYWALTQLAEQIREAESADYLQRMERTGAD